ncbi:MAG: hypothetical protein GF398_01840 [Chitinivibrionales bacterium]|nr:hypothetical protein [Chitinivibrionales bacterium]
MLVDFGASRRWKKVRKALTRSGLCIREEDDVTGKVIDSSRRDSERRRKLITTFFRDDPDSIEMYLEWSRVEATVGFGRLVDRRELYQSFRIQKSGFAAGCAQF